MSAAQSETGAAQSDGSEGGGSEGDGSEGDGSQAAGMDATDVEIAAGASGDDAGPAALPFTGFQLVVLAILGLGAIAGGAAVRTAA